MEFRTVSTRLAVNEFTLVSDYCKRKGTNLSALIKELLFEEIEPSLPSHVAGKNIIEYDKKKDIFTWSIELDTGTKSLVLKNIPHDYIENLNAALADALIFRNELQTKKRKNSVSVPKRLLRGRK